MKLQKGFTLIELMVVIVIIGILSALAIPKMFGVSAKAKAAEAPSIIANFETLESAYAQETGKTGATTEIGFTPPGTAGVTKWFTYTFVPAAAAAGATQATITATVNTTFGNCAAAVKWTSVYDAPTDCVSHGVGSSLAAACGGASGAIPAATCYAYTPNF